MNNSFLCAFVDCANQPTKFCTCRGTCTTLCENHVAKHEADRSEFHELNQMEFHEAAREIGIPMFNRRKREISEGVEFVRKAREMEEQQYQAAIAQVNSTVSYYIQWLEHLHRTFQALLETFEREKMRPLQCPTAHPSQFAAFIYSSTSIDSLNSVEIVEGQPARLFSQSLERLSAEIYASIGERQDYEKYFITVMSRPGSTGGSTEGTARGSAEGGSDVFVPFSRGIILAKWQPNREAISSICLDKALNLTSLTVSAIIPNGDVFFCGGGPENNTQAFLADSLRGTVTKLSNMTEGRSNPGVAYFNHTIFVFGGVRGRTNMIRSVERHDLHTNSWTTVRSEMSDGRAQFNPAVSNEGIYVAGGFGSTRVELFDVGKETFSLVNLALPVACGTIAIVHNGELVLLQKDVAIKWRIGAEGMTMTRLAVTVGDSNVAPIVAQNKVYFNTENRSQCDILELDLDNYSVRKVKTLGA